MTALTLPDIKGFLVGFVGDTAFELNMIEDLSFSESRGGMTGQVFDELGWKGVGSFCFGESGLGVDTFF